MSTHEPAAGIGSAGLSAALLSLPYWTQFLETGAHIIVTICGVIIGILGAYRQVRHVRANRAQRHIASEHLAKKAKR